MENFTQLGIAGLTLGILFFIVRYFVSAMNYYQGINLELTNKFIKIAEENIDTRKKLQAAIDVNTEATRSSAEVIKSSAQLTKTSTENLGKLIKGLVKEKAI